MASTQELFSQLNKYYPIKVCVVAGDALNFRQNVLNGGGKGCEYTVLTDDPDLSKYQIKCALSDLEIRNDRVLSITVGSSSSLEAQNMAIRAMEIAYGRVRGGRVACLSCIDSKLSKDPGKLHMVPLRVVFDIANSGSTTPGFGRTSMYEYERTLLKDFVDTTYYYGEQSQISFYALMPNLRVGRIVKI